jgi:hypothetical protein
MAANLGDLTAFVTAARSGGFRDAARASSGGVIHLFEDWLRPHLDSGALEPVLEPWWQRFSGPFLYYPGRQGYAQPE